MRELGYVERQHFVIEYRSGAGANAFAPPAAELVGLKVDLILTRGTAAVAAAKNATRAIPIVNLEAARMLGLAIPSSVLVQADDVIR